MKMTKHCKICALELPTGEFYEKHESYCQWCWLRYVRCRYAQGGRLPMARLHRPHRYWRGNFALRWSLGFPEPPAQIQRKPLPERAA